ncbi:MAG: O-antigen ligase family protein [Chloroflexota bacterium]
MDNDNDIYFSKTGYALNHQKGEIIAALMVTAGAALLALAPSTLLSILALLVMVAGLALRPGLGLPLLALSLPFYLFPKQLGGMAFSMPELILVANLMGAFFFAIHQRWNGCKQPLSNLSTHLDMPIALFLVAALLSLLASEVLRVSLRDLRTLILEPIAAFYLAAWFLRDRRDISRLLFALLLGGFAAAGLGLYQYLFTDHVVAVEGAKRMLGPYLSPNHLGLYMGRTIPIALALGLFVPRLRLVAALSVGLLAVALGLTFSVGAWLATLLAVCVITLLWKKRAILVLAAAVAALSVAALPLLSIERVSSHFSITRGTSFIRLHLWQSSLQMVRDHPLLGVGMDNFLYHYRGSYIMEEAVAEPNLSHPHNIVLNFWLQMGVLGIIATGWLLVALARSWLHLWRAASQSMDRALLAGIAGAMVDFLAHGMVDNSYFLVDMAFHFWLLAGMLVAIEKCSQRLLSPSAQIG